MNGLLVHILKDNGTDCTNEGITSKYNQLLLVGEGVKGPHKIKEGEPYLILEYRDLFGKKEPYLTAYTVNFNDKKNKKKLGGMMGGNFIYTSDSRFPFDYPIPVHDRYETQEEYNILSR